MIIYYKNLKIHEIERRTLPLILSISCIFKQIHITRELALIAPACGSKLETVCNGSFLVKDQTRESGDDSVYVMIALCDQHYIHQMNVTELVDIVFANFKNK